MKVLRLFLLLLSFQACAQISSVFRLSDTAFIPGSFWKPSYPLEFSSDNTYNLNSATNQSLDSLALFLNDHKGAIMEIAAHTDQRGNDSANVYISQKRAESVKIYLLSKGIEEHRLAAVGYGETQLIHSNSVLAACKSDSAKNKFYSENRRLEFRLLNDPRKSFTPQDSIFQSGSAWILPVLFDFAKATLRSESKPLLDSAAAFLIEHPELRVEIAGHTDTRTSDSYSMKLSKARANTVMRYMIDKGVPAIQLSAEGYEKTRPLISDDYINKVPSLKGREDLHRLNRRIEFRILQINK
jgi:outer membrane protein OmpA-like peptidoglycan-associated protein